MVAGIKIDQVAKLPSLSDSSEDKNKIDNLFERLENFELGLDSDFSYVSFINNIRHELMQAESSAVALPKSLKYFGPHFPVLLQLLDKINDFESKIQLYDVLSFLAMIFDHSGSILSLKFRMMSLESSFHEWGFEYMKYRI